MNVQTLCVGCMENDSGLAVCPTCGRPFDLPAKSPLQLKPRTVLREQYLIGRALGDGGFGITYLAWDLGLEMRLAVKEYLPNGVAGRGAGDTKVAPYTEQTQQEFEWGLERFMDEARVLRKFSNHPGIVSVDTVFRENGTAYLVMEFLDGATFEGFLAQRGGRVTFETAMRVALPAMDALAAVHAEGILHRDVSPDNIFLTRAGKVKLIDFGAARNALGQKSRNLSIILKEGYAPEEQYRASGIQGPWTDVYAMGATLYHAITGRIPQASLDRQAQDTLAWPSQLQIEIEPGAEAALMKALAVKANDRFHSMEDFKAAMTAAAAVRPPMPHPPPPPPFPPPGLQPQTGLRPQTVAPSSSAVWLWLTIPAVCLLIGAAMLVTVLLPKFLHRSDTAAVVTTPTPEPTPGPVPTLAPMVQEPTPAASKPDNAADNSGAPPTPAPIATAPEVAPPAPAGYDALTSQAVSYAAAGNVNNAANAYLQAVAMDPQNPKAYASLGELYLYAIRNLPEALRYYHGAVDRGGVATFHVHHDRGGGNFTVASDGRLLLSQSTVQFVSETGEDSFSVARGSVKEAKKDRVMGLFSRGQLKLNAFHIKLAGGKNYNFAPGSGFSEAERDLILEIIHKG